MPTGTAHSKINETSPAPRWVARPVAYASWLLMMAVHEIGHVLNAWLSGGHVARVHFGPSNSRRPSCRTTPSAVRRLGRTRLGLPDSAGGLRACLRAGTMAKTLLCFFAGLCLIANGGYIAVGWINAAGDAGTLLREGVPRWLMVLAGLPTLVAGLYLWHRLGPRLGLATPPSPAE